MRRAIGGFLKNRCTCIYICVCITVCVFVCVCVYGGSDGKDSACNAGNLGSIPGLGRCPGEGNGYPLQYFCLKNPRDREARQAGSVHGVVKSWK